MGRDAAEKVRTPVTKEADLYSWALRQAELLRAGRLAEIDPAGIAKEIDDVGDEQYDKLESALRVLMLHLLKWDHQPCAAAHGQSQFENSGVGCCVS